jgi:hypothetical protein
VFTEMRKRKKGKVGWCRQGKSEGKRKEKEKGSHGRGERRRERGRKRKKRKKEKGERKTLTLELVRVFLRSNSYGHLCDHLILGLIS